MPKPGTLPRWADLANPADVVNPPSGKKDSGWLTGEKPPHSYFNWWMNLVYLWAVYLDGLTNEALTWTAAHIFQAGVSMTRNSSSPTLTVDNAGSGVAIGATGSGTGAAVVGLASSATFGAVTGQSLAAGPGVQGIGGVGPGVQGQLVSPSAGAAAVQGTSANRGTFAGKFTQTNTTGTGAAEAILAEVTASSATNPGTAVKATTAGDESTGVASTAAGTNSVAVRATATGGGNSRALLTTGVAEITAGRLVHPATTEIQFDVARVAYSHVPLSTLLPVQNPGMPSYSFIPGPGVPIAARWLGRSGGTTLLVGGAFRIPAEATLDQIEFFLDNTDGVARTFSWQLYRTLYTGAGVSTSLVNPSGATMNTHSVGNGVAAWFATTVGAAVPGNSTQSGAPTDRGGDFSLSIEMPTLTTDGTFALRAIRARFSYTFRRWTI